MERNKFTISIVAFSWKTQWWWQGLTFPLSDGTFGLEAMVLVCKEDFKCAALAWWDHSSTGKKHGQKKLLNLLGYTNPDSPQWF